MVSSQIDLERQRLFGLLDELFGRASPNGIGFVLQWYTMKSQSMSGPQVEHHYCELRVNGDQLTVRASSELDAVLETSSAARHFANYVNERRAGG